MGAASVTVERSELAKASENPMEAKGVLSEDSEVYELGNPVDEASTELAAEFEGTPGRPVNMIRDEVLLAGRVSTGLVTELDGPLEL